MTQDKQDSIAGRIAWLLLAAVPAAMAAVTWHVGAEPAPWPVIANRFFAPPVLLAEAAVILLALWRRFADPRPAPPLPMLPAAAIVGLILLATATTFAVAADRGMALARLGMLVLHCAFGLSMGALAARGGGGRIAAPALATGGFVYAVLCVAYVATVDWAVHDWSRFGLGVVNVRHVGFYLAVGIAAAVATAVRASSPSRWLWALVAIAAAAMLAWSGSRGGYVALAAGSLLTAVVLGGRTWRMAAAMPAVLAAGALLSLAAPPPAPAYGLLRMRDSVGLDSPDAVSSGRLGMWSGTARQIGDRPLFGHGEAQFLATPMGLDMYHHPHQSILQTLHQWGVAGLALVSLLAAWLWPLMRRGARARPDLMPLFLVANMLLVYSLYDGIFFFVYPAMMLSGLCGALAGAGVAQGAGDRYLAGHERGRPDLPQRTP